MARLGAFCFPGSGHINPMTALCRALEDRGHSVVMFGIPDVGERVRAAGIEFYEIGSENYPPGTLKALDDRLGELSGLAAMRFTLDRVSNTGRMIFRDAPSAVREADVDALLIDEADMSGTVAEHLGIPFVSIAIVPPMNHDNRLPPFYFGWQPGGGWLGRQRNRMAMQLLSRLAKPVSNLVNAQRAEWGLRPFRNIGDALSPIAQVAQLPQALEFESAARPQNVYLTGPWVNAAQRPTIDFPWDSLDGRPLVYASLGTLQNGLEPVFYAIAQACYDLPVQLVLSLGGGIEPERLGALPGDPLIVRFAPQLEILKRAHVVITHAGINTVLEALSEGVPLVAIPLGNDQPGVAARVAARGAGIVVPRRKLNPVRLRHALRLVLEDPAYRSRAQQLGRDIREIDGPGMAAKVIERTLNLRAGAKIHSAV
ncbi:MAG: nucleotide disphospho-sugar-binding domain-containing protein [Terracidiphilus sp.]